MSGQAFIDSIATAISPCETVIHGVTVNDPFRWLEEQESSSTREWLEGQRKQIENYFLNLPDSSSMRKRVRELLDWSASSPPIVKRNRRFFLSRSQGQAQASIIMHNEITGVEKVLVDPRTRGEDVAVSVASVSPTGRVLAYAVRAGGSDTAAFEFIDVDEGFVYPELLPAGWYGGLCFKPDDSGFFYSHSNISGNSGQQSVIWHRFGTSLAEDCQVFATSYCGRILSLVHDTTGSRMLYVLLSQGPEKLASVYFHDLRTGDPPLLLYENLEGTFSPFFIGEHFLAWTDIGWIGHRIVEIEITNPIPRCWKTVASDTNEGTIQQFGMAGGYLFLCRARRFSMNLERLDLQTGEAVEICPFAHETVELRTFDAAADDLFFTVTSLTQPPKVMRYSVQSDQITVWSEIAISFDPKNIETEEVTVTSKDGSSVPMMIARRGDLPVTASLPAFLTGYGGFGSCVTPRFSAFGTFLIEQGFLFAVAAVRGGSELGAAWHHAGRRRNRQNAYDDFLACTEWLIATRRAKGDQICIGGGSNAGLLVGAALTQRPELFRAVICVGALLDMVRYHLFDLAALWSDEFGTSENDEDFRALYSYSPYHRVQDGVGYPAVLLVSGDADTRCNPLHTRKMTARLQAASISGHPILLDYTPTWGHTPVQPIDKKIEAVVRKLSFLLHEMGIPLR